MNSDNDILYKYRTWTLARHRDLLYENELYLASPKDFNDPFDCRIFPDLRLLDNDDKILQYAAGIIQRQSEAIKKRGQSKEALLRELINRLKTNLSGENESLRKLYSDVQDSSYGILSLTTNWSSILMWSHYADNNRGFCVGLDRSKLLDSKLFGKGGPVRYKDVIPSIDPLGTDLVKLGFEETHVKAKKWEHEDEYRLFAILPERSTATQRRITIPDDFFKEIILGLRFPKEDIDKVRRLGDRKKMKVYQIAMVDNEFRLTRNEI